MNKPKYFISVGEPWNFESPDGQNIINGRIVKILSATCLIFESNYELDFNKNKGSIFILFPRHLNNDFTDLKNLNTYIVINGCFLTKEYNDKLSEEDLSVLAP